MILHELRLYFLETGLVALNRTVAEAARLVSESSQVPKLNSLFREAVHSVGLIALFFHFLHIVLTRLFSGLLLTADVYIKNILHKWYGNVQHCLSLRNCQNICWNPSQRWVGGMRFLSESV